jgi:MYXO-CTERM domain-containing protein
MATAPVVDLGAAPPDSQAPADLSPAPGDAATAIVDLGAAPTDLTSSEPDATPPPGTAIYASGAGCGCRVAGSRDDSSPAVWLLLPVVVALSFRKRRGARRGSGYRAKSDSVVAISNTLLGTEL